MRTILFRGQRVDNKQWVYGYLSISHIKKGDRVFIINTTADVAWKINNEIGWQFSNIVEVIPETVSQFTGCFDKNRTRIFENDLMQHANPFEKPFVVNWDNEYSAFTFNEGSTGYSINDKSFEVVGNIFDNADLVSF